MGVRGLGTDQIKQREKTDEKILDFIRHNPTAYVRQIIEKSGLSSPNSVKFSLERLLEDKKIIRISESNYFHNIQLPKRAIGYIINYQSEEKEKEAFYDYCNKIKESSIDAIKKIDKRDFEQRKKIIVNLSGKLAEGLNNDDQLIIQDMQNELGISDVNVSMIGLYVYKITKKLAERTNTEVRKPEFYFNMLPNKYCKIDITIPHKLIQFINYNFPSSNDLQELFSKKQNYFNTKTQTLLDRNLNEIMTTRSDRRE